VKKIITGVLLSSLMTLSAQVIPGINSKGGAMVLPKGKVKAMLKHITFKRDTMYTGTDEVANVQGLEAKAKITLLALIYGITDKTSIRVVVPYKDFHAEAHLPTTAGFPVEIDNKGLGDIVVMLKHQLISMKDSGYALSIGAGLKLPTGSTDSKFVKGPPFNPTMATPLPTQLGTGKLEYKAELGFSKIFENNMRIDAHTMYTYRPLAKHDYDFGNELTYDIGFIAGVNKNINLGIEYNGKYNTDTDNGNDPEPVSPFPFQAFAGIVGYVTPQIQWLPFDKPKLHVDFGVSLLAHHNTKNYRTLEKERYTVRIGYLF
jgi:hypothetical protein